MGKSDHAQRGAGAGRRQPAGIAVGQQAAVRCDQRGAVPGNGVAQRPILRDQPQRLLPYGVNEIRLRQRLRHARQIIHQVYRGRARRAQYRQIALKLWPALSALR